MVKHVIESQQFDKDFLFKLFKRADELRNSTEKPLVGKVLTTLFYESSTRTRLSFESAMLKLGGSVMGTESAKLFSSVSKGESLEDTIRVISSYCDAIVLRHNEEGSAEEASLVSSVPIINGGDGKGQHPTQTLLDVYTIYKEIGKLDGLKIAMVGDLLSGRTVRSLCYMLGKFSDVEIIFISPENLRIGLDIKAYLIRHGVKFKEETNLEKILSKVDIIYMTRIQKERMSEEDYLKANGHYKINEDNLPLIKKDTRILHPLPHVGEVSFSVKIEENDPRIAYFRQAENGLYVRMALLEYLLK